MYAIGKIVIAIALIIMIVYAGNETFSDGTTIPRIVVEGVKYYKN